MIAVVGAGRMGSVHLRALGETRLARLAAVVEPVAESRKRVADAIRRARVREIR